MLRCPGVSTKCHPDVAAALERLGVDRLVLVIHDASFPAAAADDTGRGSPYGAGGLALFELAAAVGFNGVQLGPQGETTAHNPSPYDGTIFSKSFLSIALRPLADDPRWGGLLPRELLDEIVAARPGRADRVPYAYVHAAHRRALREAFAAFALRRDALAPLAGELAAFEREHAAWLDRYGLFEALALEHGTAAWPRWASEEDRRLWAPPPGAEAEHERRRRELRARYRDELAFHAFCQFVAHAQHAELRRAIAPLGVKLYGDLQIGHSIVDAWSYQSLYLAGYRMGAPPSRTNPDGQPWGYPVLDPAQYRDGDEDGPARQMVCARMDKMLTEFDGVRIDHPHGLVCPWVYRADDPDPLRAVQTGARLFAAPDLPDHPDHPDLVRFAIPRPDQVDRAPGALRWGDHWVRELDAAQIDRYALLFDCVIDRARAHGRDVGDVVCEVLSTWPYPLRRVMERHGLGRFRVTQKASPRDPTDVYRSENARPSDWIMVGNHDTRPLRIIAETWRGTPEASERAAYLASRLIPDGAARAVFARDLEADPARMVEAMFADLFASPARNVSVFFADLFGCREVYNVPGTVAEANWSLRLPPDFAELYRDRVRDREALDLPRVLALALRARGTDEDDALAARLETTTRR
jgi:4-alpha-glucanotransferase